VELRISLAELRGKLSARHIQAVNRPTFYWRLAEAFGNFLQHEPNARI
jgi:hypothetical protein